MGAIDCCIDHKMSELIDRFKRNNFVLMQESLTPDQVLEIYRVWASTYEGDLQGVQHGYHNPDILVELYNQQVDLMSPAPDRQQLRILDVACGTGLVGERLQKLGYQRVDGVDGSPEMVEQARGKDVYENLFVEMIEDHPMSCAEPQTYDAVLTAGSFCPNHMTPSCLRHLCAVVKPGGLVCIGMRKAYGLTDSVLKNLEPELVKLQDEGLWQKVLWEERPFYYKDLPGMYYILRVL